MADLFYKDPYSKYIRIFGQRNKMKDTIQIFI